MTKCFFECVEGQCIMLCHVHRLRCFRSTLKVFCQRTMAYAGTKSEMESASREELNSWLQGIKPWRQGGWLHLNAAGASPCSQEVYDVMLGILEREREVGGYEAEAQYRMHGRDARDAAAELLGCDADEIALTESAQSAWARAFASLDFQPNDHIFCWESEYAGNAVAFIQAAKKGVQLHVLPMQSDGVVDLESLEKSLQSMSSSSRALVALTHIQTNSSIVQPAFAVGEIAKKHNAIFLLDTCQSIGQLPVNVRSLGCDFACGTGRKWLRGPRGTGFLYARKAVLPQTNQRGGLDHPSFASSDLVGEPAMIDHVSASWKSSNHYELSAGARRFEMWESSPALQSGLAAAIDACRTLGPDRIWKRASFLAKMLREELQRIPGVRCRDAPKSAAAATRTVVQCAIVTFEASELGIASEDIKAALTERRIAVSVAPAFHTFVDNAWKLPSTVRLSPSYYNTQEDIHAVVQAIREILESKKQNVFSWCSVRTGFEWHENPEKTGFHLEFRKNDYICGMCWPFLFHLSWCFCEVQQKTAWAERNGTCKGLRIHHGVKWSNSSRIQLKCCVVKQEHQQWSTQWRQPTACRI